MFNKKLFRELLIKTEWRLLYCDIFYCYCDIDDYLNKLIIKKNYIKTNSLLLSNLNF